MSSISQPNSQPASDEPQPRLSNFTVRLLTAIIFIPFGIIGMYIGGWVWTLMLVPLAVVGALEFYSLPQGRPNQGIALVGVPAVLAVLLAYHLDLQWLWLGAPAAAVLGALAISLLRHGDFRRGLTQSFTTLMGILYLGFPAGFLIAIRDYDKGFMWLVVICGVTWGTDTLAYAGGRVWGKTKLAPRLSPKKTVEGAIVGIIGGIIPATLFLWRGDAFSTTAEIMILLAPFVAIIGDLLESAIKRYYAVKDSHLAHFNIIPGHGGVLDRVDALLLVSVFSYFYIHLTGLV